ncbi:MAG TPA: nucleoside triphosphate pyrophosphohydrolase [Chitinophagaceae bacterium]|nr:nucleoside triphosphate pyrophosphohydrolase [Chitinophagaceae bacterium]
MYDQDTAAAFLRLVTIMDELREKCPWDKKQTIQTLRHLSIEETYELADAISESNWQGIREELGDLLLHIVFYAKIGTEQKEFTLPDVIHAVCDKLIRRHPHIYGDVQVSNEEEVKQNWEKLKLQEGKKSVLGGVPRSLPSMVKAIRLQEKSKQVGFEWENAEQVWHKVEEEMGELKQAVSTGKPDQIEEELGDVFFSLVNYARFLQVDAENALERTNKKFMSRFLRMESLAMSENKNLQEMSLEEMDQLWERIKQLDQQEK